MIKVFDLVADKEKALIIAQSIGLDSIDSQKVYKLKKLGSKKSSSKGYPDAFDVIQGTVSLVGLDDQVWLLLLGSGRFEWFKTSPILSCKETELCFELETENSFYILEK